MVKRDKTEKTSNRDSELPAWVAGASSSRTPSHVPARERSPIRVTTAPVVVDMYMATVGNRTGAMRTVRSDMRWYSGHAPGAARESCRMNRAPRILCQLCTRTLIESGIGLPLPNDKDSNLGAFVRRLLAKTHQCFFLCPLLLGTSVVLHCWTDKSLDPVNLVVLDHNGYRRWEYKRGFLLLVL